MSVQPFYNPQLTYEENYLFGPFGLFANNNVMPQPTARPTKTFLTLPIHETFGIPAGPLLNSRFCDAAFRYGFDLCVYKTVRSRELACLPFPNILEVETAGTLTPGRTVHTTAPEVPAGVVPRSITNSFGVPSKRPDIWQPDMKEAVDAMREGQILIGSFQGSGEGQAQIDDYITTARLVAETGAPVLEANLSCPNEGKTGLLCFDAERVRAIVDGIRRAVNDRPLLLKLAYFENEKQLQALVAAVGDRVDGLCAINTLQARVYDDQDKPALPGREFSGICGAAIQWAGLKMVKTLAELREKNRMKFAIVGGGGVMEPKDDTAFRAAGADAVMSATAAMWNPMLALQIKEQYHYEG